MILTGPEIISAHRSDRIVIEPFCIEQVEPNSYAFRLENKLLIDSGEDFDAAYPTRFHEVTIMPEGYLLLPKRLYLGLTIERTGSPYYAQMINGNRSLGALGIWIHVSAPLAHSGSNIRWTLEIRVVKPVVIYPGMIFGKIIFIEMLGDPLNYTDSGQCKYAENDVRRSHIFEEILEW